MSAAAEAKGAEAAPPEPPALRRTEECWIGSFRAMASPCEVLVETDGRHDAQRIVSAVAAEARRIEARLSRYRTGNIIHAINTSAGRPVAVDQETARLLDFARSMHHMSEGRFDVTSGVLRRVWSFDGSDRVPEPEAVLEVLKHVGWQRVAWDGETIRLEPGMEIDLGGIGKEYAVDRAAMLAAREHPCSTLVNFGGDMAVSRPRIGGAPWRVGMEDPRPGKGGTVRRIRLESGALATSGDARRFLVKDGVRYGHILDPRTGWPVAGSPASVTVAAGTCVEAGMFATLAMLEGEGAEAFLKAQGRTHWIVRSP